MGPKVQIVGWRGPYDPRAGYKRGRGVSRVKYFPLPQPPAPRGKLAFWIAIVCNLVCFDPDCWAVPFSAIFPIVFLSISHVRNSPFANTLFQQPLQPLQCILAPNLHPLHQICTPLVINQELCHKPIIIPVPKKSQTCPGMAGHVGAYCCPERTPA